MNLQMTTNKQWSEIASTEENPPLKVIMDSRMHFQKWAFFIIQLRNMWIKKLTGICNLIPKPWCRYLINIQRYLNMESMNGVKCGNYRNQVWVVTGNSFSQYFHE